MTESAADRTAIENAYRDIDRYVSETSQPASNGAQLLSPSQRLRVLGVQHASSSKIPSAAQEISTPLSANEFRSM
ncbi:MAG: hypothetical protein WBE48_05585 [Xanthobacteraceae bacterium]